jgi:hypothetical protein
MAGSDCCRLHLGNALIAGMLCGDRRGEMVCRFARFNGIGCHVVSS